MGEMSCGEDETMLPLVKIVCPSIVHEAKQLVRLHLVLFILVPSLKAIKMCTLLLEGVRDGAGCVEKRVEVRFEVL
jgi:hypothetical protein